MKQRPSPREEELVNVDRIPPLALDSEQAILGTLIQGGNLGVVPALQCLAAAEELLVAEDFYLRGHRLIFAAIGEIGGRGEAPDLAMVIEELERAGELEEAGGKPYLVACREAGLPPTPSFIRQHAAKVRDASLLRRVQDEGGELVGTACDKTPEEVAAGLARLAEEVGGRAGGGRRPSALTRRLADVEPETVRWLWPGRLPLGKLAIIDGDPGQGKSLIACDLAARVSRGIPMPDGAASELDGPAGVVLLCSEDAAADTLVPRLTAAGADLNKIDILEGVQVPGRVGTSRPPTLGDLGALREAIQGVGAGLLVCDPLMGFVPPGVDSHSDQEMRCVLAPVATLANETGCTVLFIRHLNKQAGGSAIYRGGGSIAIIGACRSAMLAAPDPRDEAGLLRVLASTKANLAAAAASLAYQIEVVRNDVVRVRWEGTSRLSAKALLSVGRPLGETSQAILDAYVLGTEEMTPSEMAARLDKKEEVVQQRMWQLAQKGLLHNNGGRYSLARARVTA